MTDDRTSRPLSGEIMAGAAPEGERRMGERRAGERRIAPDVVDAEYVTFAPVHASSRPEPIPPFAPAHDVPPSPGMDILRGRKEGRGSSRGGPIFWTFGLCLVLATFWVSGGHALVSRADTPAPAASTPHVAGALRLAGISSRIERQADRSFLLVDGEVLNEGGAGAALPGLEIRVAGKDGRVTRYFLGTSGRSLEPGGRFAFSSRLEAPKDGVETVTVDFRKEG